MPAHWLSNPCSVIVASLLLSTKEKGQVVTFSSLERRPGLRGGGGGGGGRGRRLGIGRMRTRCYYADLNNPIMYGYCLVYLPFDFNSSCSMYPQIAVWTVRISNEISR